MAKHNPAPADHKEVRAVWLSPKQRTDLKRAAVKRDWSVAKYAENAILEKVARDLAPPIPDMDAILEQMRDLRPDLQEQAMALLANLLRANQAQSTD